MPNQEEEIRKVHEELNMLRKALEELQFNRAGNLLTKEFYNQMERHHLTGTTGQPQKDNNSLIEFNEPPESVTIFNVSTTACYIDVETLSIDTNAATTLSVPLAGAFGAFVTIPLRTKRISARTAAGTVQLVVWGLRW